jgi:uncharacterized membrane protein YfhO
MAANLKKIRVNINAFIRRYITKSEYFYLLGAFLLPLVILWLVYIAMEVYPFGSNSVLVLDLNGQYVSFYEYLRSLIREGGSLLYTWERALGGEFLGIFSYYLSSPFSLIVALLPKGNMTEALLLIMLLKCGSSGLAFGWYLHKTRPVRPRAAHVIMFSAMYALCSYAVVYGHNIMWMDQLIILPVLTYGIEQIVLKRGYKIFTVALVFALVTNFYIGFMMCIYTFFYFIYYYLLKKGGYPELIIKYRFIRAFGRIGVFSVIALCIAAVILIPAYYSLTFGKTTFSNPDYAFTQRFDFFDIILKFFIGSYDTVRPEGLPWVYCGTLTVIMLPIFFLSPKIDPREKIFAGVAIVFFIICFNSTTIDLVWHGFQRPNWLNNRYSFMLCFLLVLYAFQGMEHLRKIDFKWVTAVGGFLILAVFIVQKLDYEFLDDLKFAWVGLAFICVLVAVLGVEHRGMLHRYGIYIVLIVVSIELFSAGLLNITSLDKDVVFTSRTSYATYMNRVTPIVEKIKASDTSFYRMEKALYRKTNDPMAFGFNGLSNSTSTLNASIINLMHKYGLSSESHWSKYIGGNPVSDTLFGLKYIIYPDEKYSEVLYKSYIDDDTNLLYAYENPYAMSVAYTVNNLVTDIDIDDFKNPFMLMNTTVTNMLGEEKEIKLFKNIEMTDTVYTNCDITPVSDAHKRYTPEDASRDAKITLTFTVPTADEIFMDIPTNYPRELKIRINGQEHGTILGNDTNSIISLGFYEPGEELIVSLTLAEDMLYVSNKSNWNTTFYYLDTALFRETIPELSDPKYNYNITSYSNTSLKGTVTADEEHSILVTTIPYDEGWIIKVDGKKTEPFKLMDSLIAVYVDVGEHEITFDYMPVHFQIGLALCITGITVFALIIIADTVKKRLTKKQQNNR